jgi:glycosyltransferase involved in cell wall biosynthesis
VIATHVGGIPDVVTDGVNGLLVPPENERALAAAILALLRDPGRMGAFGEAAGRSVGERFESAATIREIERLYDSVWHDKHVTA